MTKLKIGILGAGHLGKIHMRCLQQLQDIYDIAGYFDPDEQTWQTISEEFGLHRFASADELIEEVDVVDVVTPTPSHHGLIHRSLQAAKHVFTEKPVTETAEQASELLDLADEKEVLVQVGHVERYNPAFVAARKVNLEPMFIEGHRLAQFNPRGTDVSVVHDLMIHDLDILVALIPHSVAQVHASGVAIVSDQPDICNARIEFVNGAVANLTASRISLKNMRKMRLFQPEAYVSIDFLEKQAEVIQLFDSEPDDGQGGLPLELKGRKKWIRMHQPDTVESNAILEELRSFHRAIVDGRQPDVTLRDALAAMVMAQKVLNAIEVSAKKAQMV